MTTRRGKVADTLLCLLWGLKIMQTVFLVTGSKKSNRASPISIAGSLLVCGREISRGRFADRQRREFTKKQRLRWIWALNENTPFSGRSLYIGHKPLNTADRWGSRDRPATATSLSDRSKLLEKKVASKEKREQWLCGSDHFLEFIFSCTS